MSSILWLVPDDVIMLYIKQLGSISLSLLHPSWWKEVQTYVSIWPYLMYVISLSICYRFSHCNGNPRDRSPIRSRWYTRPHSPVQCWIVRCARTCAPRCNLWATLRGGSRRWAWRIRQRTNNLTKMPVLYRGWWAPSWIYELGNPAFVESDFQWDALHSDWLWPIWAPHSTTEHTANLHCDRFMHEKLTTPFNRSL